jgi:prolyl oligopeptidase
MEECQLTTFLLKKGGNCHGRPEQRYQAAFATATLIMANTGRVLPPCIYLNMKTPDTKKENIIEKIHGTQVLDPYRWLENTEDKEVGGWIKKQNNYTQSILDKAPYKDMLRTEFEKLFREETIGFPHPRNGFYFFKKRKAEEDLAVLYVKEGLHGELRILVNPNELSKQKGSLVHLHGYSTSKDARYITYGLSEAANDAATIYVMDVTTGENLPDTIPAYLYPTNGSWNIDNTGFWYTRRKENSPKGEEKFHKKVFYHILGTDYTEDELVFGESFAKEDIIFASATHDGHFLKVSVYIFSEKTQRQEIWLKDLQKPNSNFVPVVSNIKGNQDISFKSVIHRDYIYLLHNVNTPNYKIDRVFIKDIEKGMGVWQTIIAEHQDKIIEDMSVVSNKLFVSTLENVYTILREYTLDGEFKREISLPTLGSASNIIAEPEGEEGFFGFSSFAYPLSIFRIDFNTNDISIYDTQKVAVDISNIVTEQVWYTSKDGTQVPMFLVHKKGVGQGSVAPTVIYGYGGFGISETPGFMKSILPFIQAGGIFAIANVRGGGEFGETWHMIATKEHKQKSFDDFIAAAEFLIQNKYTSTDRLAIEGGSNGGLLVGAAMTQRPELYKAVIMNVPVADMIRYHLFHGGRHWIPDYGSAEDVNMLPHLLRYSPYHNVKDGTTYPATFITTSDQDDRVHPSHAYKMAARLQEANISENPIILRVEIQAGHSGAKDISRYLDKLVDKWSFIFGQLGI